MEIDFNPSRVPKSDLGQPVARTGTSPAAPETASFPSTASLESKLSNISLVRPERVDQAKALVVDGTYPPVELLTRIAALLAVRLRE
jgi:hypothetical protein